MLYALNEKTHPSTFDTSTVHSFSPHRRALTRRRWFSNLLRATNSFHTRPYDRQFLRRKWCQQQQTELFNILQLSVHGSHSFVDKPSPNLIPYRVKNSSTFKILGSLLLFSPKISTGVSKKNCFVATPTSVESWVKQCGELGEFSPKSSMSSILNTAGHNCFIFSRQQFARTFWLRFKISLFSNSQSEKFELIRKSYVPRALRFSCQGPAG